jgi:hypothetical protein
VPSSLSQFLTVKSYAGGRVLTALALVAVGVVAASAGTSGAASQSIGGRVRLAGAQPIWLCRPGMTTDPCAPPTEYDSVAANGTVTVEPLNSVATPAVDCFYVYPTVSAESSQNANLAIQAAEIDAARAQASPFSTECNVWAPMYKQVTVKGLFNVSRLKQSVQVAFASVLQAWKDYLANDNDGRPFVLIGHSQGAAMLILLIEKSIDRNPAVRRRLISAILLGGNVTVPTGKVVGGSFHNVPACTSLSETGCVVAYSSFLKTPPADSLFGRPGIGVSALSDQTASKGLKVLCVNPADPGGAAPLDPLFIQGSGAAATWVTYPGLYSASCKTKGGATWLQVDVHRGAGDTRPVVTQSLGPTWGLHLSDPNLTMLDLLAMVHDEIAAYVP